MKNCFESISLLSMDFSNLAEKETIKITGKNQELCGFLEKTDGGFMFFNQNRAFEGFCATNPLGNIEQYNSLGSFNGFITNNDSMIKYGKSGEYCGYFIPENGNLSEFDKKGSYLGYFCKENDGSVNKYDSMGKLELSLKKSED